MNPMAAEPITTHRLALVPLQPRHATEMAGVLADPDLYTFTGGEPPTAQDLRATYERWTAGSPNPAESWCNWFISLQDRLAGTVQATITTAAGHRTAEIAWIVGTPWQGQGIATESARALVTWLAQQKVQLIVAHIHPDHLASAAVARAAGLRPTDRWQDGERRWQHRPGQPDSANTNFYA
jgi:RimJ/RimL family protein N-acetyltransferase